MRLESLCTAACGVALAATLLGAPGAIKASESSVEQKLLAAQRSLISANNRADLAMVDQLTADEWIGINAAGVIRTKAEMLEDIAKRGPATVQATPEQLLERQKEWKVFVYDRMGIVTRLTAGDHGSRSWISTVWVLRHGRWRRVLSHETTAAEDEGAPMRPEFMTLAMWRVEPDQQEAFVAAWKRLGDTFSHLPHPPSGKGILLQSASDSTLFYSFGPWSSMADIDAMRSNPEAQPGISALRALCTEAVPGAYRVVAESP